MNLFAQLNHLEEAEQPIKVAVIGTGKFGSMFLSQIRLTPGMHLLGVADLSVERAKKALLKTGWPRDQIKARSIAKALAEKSTFVTDDAKALISGGGVDVVVEATGVPDAGVDHALAAFSRGRHVVMVNVEADVLCGPLLAQKAKSAGVSYSMAYGDQPALICEQVDWARACGFQVIGAGKGTLYMPEFHNSTPDTVWDYYGITPRRARDSGMNPKMFNSFLDGTKSGIEMAAVSNACNLRPPSGGLKFPSCSISELASKIIPREEGGYLEHEGQVEVVSSRTRNGTDLEENLRWGTYVTFKAPSDYVRSCFSDYGLITDQSGNYSALWRPYHLIGLELGISVANVGLFGLPTGTPQNFNADVVAVTKRDLKPGETLDGEGGYTVWGQVMPSKDSMKFGAVPIGLANGIQAKKKLNKGDVVSWSDVRVPDGFTNLSAYKIRQEMVSNFWKK